jgi:hypothetical protein
LNTFLFHIIHKRDRHFLMHAFGVSGRLIESVCISSPEEG